MPIFRIAALTGLSYYFLKQAFYRHYLLSTGIVLIDFRVIVISELNAEWIFFYLIYASILSVIDYSFKIYEKYLMEVGDISLYRILLIKGVLSFITIIIRIAIGNLSFPNLFSLFNNSEWLDSVGDIIVGGLNFLFDQLISYYFSPIHIIFGQISENLFLGIALIFINDDYKNNLMMAILKVIGLIFILFGCLLYNELLILYLCGMEKNTKKEIAKRGILLAEHEIGYEFQIEQSKDNNDEEGQQ